MTEKRKKSERRRRNSLLQVRVSEEELTIISERSNACGITCSGYLRQLGLGFLPASKLDRTSIRELCKVAGDLGRLGGLQKLWLSMKRNDPSSHLDSVSIRSIDALWNDLQSCVRTLKERIARL